MSFMERTSQVNEKDIIENFQHCKIALSYEWPNGLGVFHGIKMYQVNKKDIIETFKHCKIGMYMLGCSKAQKAN